MVAAIMPERRDPDEIVLKGSGKRARLEVKVDDVEKPRIVVDDLPPDVPARLPARQPPRTTRPSARSPAPTTPPSRPPSRPGSRSTPVYPPPEPTTIVSGGPPTGGGPPVRYVHDNGGQAWWQSRSASVAAAVVLVLAVVAVLAVVLGREDQSKIAVAASLESTKSTIEDAIKPVRAATRLGPLRKAARRAKLQVAALDSPDIDLMHSKNRELAEPAMALVASEKAYLKALGGLARLTPERVGESGRATWRRIWGEINTAAEDVVTASAAVSASELDEPSGGVGFTKADLDQALSPVETLVDSGYRKLKRWSARREAYRAAIAAAKRRSIPVMEYRRDVEQALDAYASDRADVRGWANNASSFRRTDGSRLHGQVQGFANEHKRTVDELRIARAQRPVLPSSVRRGHESFEIALSASLDGLVQADAAISAFTSDSVRHYSDVTEVAEWDEFLRLIQSANDRMARLRGSWTSAVGAEISRIQSSIGVKKPVYPKL